MRIGLMLSLLAFAAGAIAEDDWQAAEKKIVRLAPSAFPRIPEPIRDWLDANACTIPQHYADPNPHNIVRGRFTGTESSDWAVLCSRRGVSAVVVFAEGSASAPYELNPARDAAYLQGIGDGRIGFSRLIEVADPTRIRGYFEYYGEKAPPLSHDGIDDIFDPKASVVHYFARGRWHQWAGAD